MQFLVIAHDGTDDHALARRMAVREAISKAPASAPIRDDHLRRHPAR